MQRSAAFTLLEALLVGAVIAVLLALLFPLGAAMRQRSLDQRSLQQLRQIGTALTVFIGENSGTIMPRAYNADAVPPGQKRYWTATLFSRGYLTEKRTFYDPRFPPFKPDENATSKRIEDGTPETYGMRDWVKPGEVYHGNYTRAAKKISIITNPADFFIVADSYWTAWQTQGYGVSPGVSSANLVRLDRKGFAGAVFLDGHVERKPREYFETLGVTQGQYSDGQPYKTWTPEPGQ